MSKTASASDTHLFARSFHRILMILALLALLFSLVMLVVHGANLMLFPYDYDQGEGFELVDTVLFSQFEWPYRNTDSFPFYSSNYPPLYHVIAAPFVWIFGPAYWYGRLLSLLSAFVAAGAVGYAVHRETGHRLIALLSGLAFLASNTIYHISPLFRQHISMVAFETVAVVILASAFANRRRSQVALSMGLLIAAGYTKQLAAISAIAVFVWMFIRSPRRSILWGLCFGLVGAAIFVGLNLATAGEWWRQAIVANVNEFRQDQMVGLFKLWWQLHGFLIVPTALYIIYELYFSRLSVYSIWFIFSVLLGGIGSGTWGAGDSYFATAIAAMCILSGMLFARIISQNWAIDADNFYFRRLIRPLRAWGQIPLYSVLLMLIPLLYLGYARATLKMPTSGFFQPIASALSLPDNTGRQFFDSASHNVLGYAQIGHLVTAADHEAGRRIVEIIQSSDKPAISEDAGFSLAAGREVITNPTQLLNLWRADVFDGTEIIDMIENQAFGVIVLRARFYHYRAEEIIEMNGFGYEILYPVAPQTDPELAP